MSDFCPHNLTSDVSHSPYVVSSSSIANSGFEDYFCFDGSIGTGWSSSFGAEPCWIEIDLGSAQTVLSYALASITTRGSYMPKTWNLQGSNDNATWTTVDTRLTEENWGSGETRTYQCTTTTTAYRYWRVYVTAPTGGYIQIGEIYLYSTTGGIAPGTYIFSPVYLSGMGVFVETCSSTYNTVGYAFDQTTTGNGQLLFVSSPPWWIDLDCGAGNIYRLGSYSLLGGRGQGVTAGPNAWTIQGSNDNATWTTVDTRSGITWTAGVIQAFTCSSPSSTGFRYYKMAITANNGSASWVEVSNISYTGVAGSLSTAQTITFAAIPNHSTTDAPFTLAPTASSGLSVSLAVTSGPATISADTVTLTGATGTITIQATQAGNGTYAAATPVSQSFTVSTAAQTITFPAILNHAPTDAPFSLGAAASSGLAVSYAVTSGPATVSGSTVTLTGELGTVTIQATQAGNGTYAAASPVNQSFTVVLTPQTITFGAIPGHSTTDAPFTLAPSASSGLTVSLAVTSGPANISGNVVTLTGTAGTVAIQATQPGNATYAAATPVNQSFTVSLAPQTITFGAIPGHVANDPPFTLAPTASSGLAVSLTVTSGPAMIVGDVITFTGAAGTVTIQATQAGNGTYAAATPVNQSFAVAASQRGNIAHDQIRTADRTGNGPQLLTYTIPAPASATSAGTPGQVAFDSVGNWYWCYAANCWARIGPGGYGSAASPPSW